MKADHKSVFNGLDPRAFDCNVYSAHRNARQPPRTLVPPAHIHRRKYVHCRGRNRYSAVSLHITSREVEEQVEHSPERIQVPEAKPSTLCFALETSAGYGVGGYWKQALCLLAVCGKGRQRASGAVLASRTGCVLLWVNWLFALFAKHTSIKNFLLLVPISQNSNSQAAPIGLSTTHQASHSDRDTAQTHGLAHGGWWSACES